MFLEEKRTRAKVLQLKKHGDLQELTETQTQTVGGVQRGGGNLVLLHEA